MQRNIAVDLRYTLVVFLRSTHKCHPITPKYGMSFVGYLCSLFFICAIDARGSLCFYGLTLIPVYICNDTHYKIYDEITYPFPDINDAAVEVGNGMMMDNRMAWQWTETLVEIRETLADIRGTTK